MTLYLLNILILKILKMHTISNVNNRHLFINTVYKNERTNSIKSNLKLLLENQNVNFFNDVISPYWLMLQI